MVICRDVSSEFRYWSEQEVVAFRWRAYVFDGCS